MASSSAAWVLGGVRLISSASSRLAKIGPRRNSELLLAGGRVGLQHLGADDVGGHQVGGELDALELKVQHLRDGADHQRLGHAGQADQQRVAAGDDAHEHLVEHVASGRR
jgi:hypothetical protein